MTSFTIHPPVVHGLGLVLVNDLLATVVSSVPRQAADVTVVSFPSRFHWTHPLASDVTVTWGRCARTAVAVSGGALMQRRQNATKSAALGRRRPQRPRLHGNRVVNVAVAMAAGECPYVRDAS